MNILITGGTGFIGQLLCPTLLSQGHKLVILTRQPGKVTSRYTDNVRAISRISDLSPDKTIDAIINLSGEGIADARWSTNRKKKLRDSRIAITDEIVEFIDRAKKKPSVLISGSAIGFYGDQGDLVLNEQAGGKEDFAQTLCQDWEEAARRAEPYAVRVCLLRTGLVIGRDGGFLKRMLLPFKFGLGGQLGDGTQWMSWIHRHDLIRIILFLLEHQTLTGPFNATAPNPVTNQAFTQQLASSFGKKPFLPVPAFVLKIALGEMSSLLLGGQRVVPQALVDAGFEFNYSNLDEALNSVINPEGKDIL